MNQCGCRGNAAPCRLQLGNARVALQIDKTRQGDSSQNPENDDDHDQLDQCKAELPSSVENGFFVHIFNIG